MTSTFAKARMMPVVETFVGLALLGAACAPGGSGGRPPTTAAPQPIADNDVTVFPDPRDRTLVRMERARIFISESELEHGRLPPTIEAAGSDPAFPIDRDGWGRAFRYSFRNGDYDFRSAGPDEIFCTEDDIRMSKAVPPLGL